MLLLHWKDFNFRGYRLHKRTPIPLIVVLVSVLLSWAIDLKGRWGVEIIGSIPSALPTPQWPIESLDQALAVAPSSIVLALVSFVQTVSLAVLFGKRKGENVSGASEMMGECCPGWMAG